MNTEKDIVVTMISDYIEAIMFNPKYASAFGFHGQVDRQLAQENQAIQNFDKALSLKTDLNWVRQELEEIQ